MKRKRERAKAADAELELDDTEMPPSSLRGGGLAPRRSGALTSSTVAVSPAGDVDVI